MELTESWHQVMPDDVLSRYQFAETRNAAVLMKSTHPEEFSDMCRVLAAFNFDTDRIVRPGGSKHLISIELDEVFRELGWREGAYHQDLTTTLLLEPYRAAGERERTIRRTVNAYGGHKIDNVKGRVGLDVEWNPKDGNLDRDFGNFRALYDGGALDVGVIITRTVSGMRDLWVETIARSKQIAHGPGWGADWLARLDKTPDDPLGTSTTSNFEKLVPRLERGDGGGCPVLAIAITDALYDRPPDRDLAIQDLARSVGRGIEPMRLSQRMGLLQATDEVASEILKADGDV